MTERDTHLSAAFFFRAKRGQVVLKDRWPKASAFFFVPPVPLREASGDSYTPSSDLGTRRGRSRTVATTRRCAGRRPCLHERARVDPEFAQRDAEEGTRTEKEAHDIPQSDIGCASMEERAQTLGQGLSGRFGFRPLAAVDSNRQVRGPRSKRIPKANATSRIPRLSSAGLLTPIQEEPNSTPSQTTTPPSEDVTNAGAGDGHDVGPCALDFETPPSKDAGAARSVGSPATSSPTFDEWLAKLGIRDALNTPGREELEGLKSASAENRDLRKLLERVKEVELEIAAEEARSAAEIWDSLEKEW